MLNAIMDYLLETGYPVVCKAVGIAMDLTLVMATETVGLIIDTTMGMRVTIDMTVRKAMDLITNLDNNVQCKDVIVKHNNCMT